MRLTWKLSGEAGFGITTIGVVFSKLCTRQGYEIFDYAEFPSLIRGGFTTHETVISDTPINTLPARLDVLICLCQDGYDRDQDRIQGDTLVLYDAERVTVKDDKAVHLAVPYREIKLKHKAHQVMVNVVSVGATFAVFGWDIRHVFEVIEQDFARKGQEVINYNKVLAKEGYDFVSHKLGEDERLSQSASRIRVALKEKNTSMNPKAVMAGNEVFAYAATVADCRAFCAYPMSPSTGAFTTLASWAKQTGMVVRHCEDEIAVANQALGFSFGGVRTAVSTSGGGFALMVEAISYAGVAEIPLVVFLAQRPGPATGLPTWTAQADLLFAVHAGHGEFPKIVLAPGDAQEMFELTLKAFDLADIYQTPVIILSDKFLSESHFTIDTGWLKELTDQYTPNRGKIVLKTTRERYLRYKDEEDGISELLIPGIQKGYFWQANSYEHLEDSHTTEEGPEVKLQMDKRARKRSTYLAKHFVGPKRYGDESANIVFVTWGSSLCPVEEAIRELCASGKRVGGLHFTHVYPLDRRYVSSYFNSHTRYILVEGNSEGQFGQLLMQTCGIEVKEKILKYDGRPIWPNEIVRYALS
jgi:2-oxoglutarate ferredoxin oxidoreductase subunit alpha